MENRKFIWSRSPDEIVASFKETPIQNGDITNKKVLSALVIHNSNNGYSMSISGNTASSLKQLKLSAALCDLTNDEIPDLNQYDVVIFSDILTDKYSETLEKLFDYASLGGRLIMAGGLDSCTALSRFAPQLGISEMNPDVNPFVYADKVNIEASFAPGFEKGTSAEGWAVTSDAYIVSVNRDAEVFLSYECNDGGKIPILWKYKIGQGVIVVSNTDMFVEKHNRGVIAGAVMNLFDAFIYPIFDAAVIFIDDFPAPVREGYFDSITEEYDRDIPDFFREIWWPDMLAKANYYNVKYTGLLVTTYNDLVEPPFYSEPNQRTLSLFATSLLMNGHEVGLHGYNHNSLMMPHSYGKHEPMYPPWPSIENMTLSLKQMLDDKSVFLPDYNCVTYVPPSNMLSEEGRQALLSALPDLYNISGHYFDIDEDEGVCIYIQEFDVAEDGIVNIPRIMSGMKPDSSEMWVVHNGIAQYGIVSHFLHPDDILDPERNYGLGWNDLSDGFDDFLDDIRRLTPNLRGLTATDTAIEIEKVHNLKIHQQVSSDRIAVALENFQGEVHFYSRLPGEPVKVNGCFVEKLEEYDTPLYLIKAVAPDFSIVWK